MSWKIMMVLGYLVVLGIMDIREKQVPLCWLAAGLAVALAIGIGETIAAELAIAEGLANAEGGMHWLQSSFQMLLGLMPGLFFLGMAGVSGKVGTGDALALMAIGLITDYRVCMVVFGTSLLLTSVFAIGMIALRRMHIKASLPYIPFLAAAYMGYWICGGV